MPEYILVTCRLDRGDMWKSTVGKAQYGKRIEGGMECKPRKTLWVIGQDDGPCRQKENLNEDKSVQNIADRCEMGSVTDAEAYDGVRDWMWDRGEDVTKAV